MFETERHVIVSKYGQKSVVLQFDWFSANARANRARYMFKLLTFSQNTQGIAYARLFCLLYLTSKKPKMTEIRSGQKLIDFRQFMSVMYFFSPAKQSRSALRFLLSSYLIATALKKKVFRHIDLMS